MKQSAKHLSNLLMKRPNYTSPISINTLRHFLGEVENLWVCPDCGEIRS